jgi:hypothetical protein
MSGRSDNETEGYGGHRSLRPAEHELEQRPPDLQALVSAQGSYGRITPEAWLTYQGELAEWRARTAVGDFSPSVGRPLGCQATAAAGGLPFPEFPLLWPH